MVQDGRPEPDRTGRSLSSVLVPVGIILFCAVAYWLTTGFETVPPILKRGMQPSDFPQLVISLIIALAIILLVRERHRVTDPIGGCTWATIAALVAFIVVADIDLFLALGLFALSLSRLWGERRAWALGLVGVVVPLVVFLVFGSVFEVRFPRGILTTLWYG